jgi:phasin
MRETDATTGVKATGGAGAEAQQTMREMTERGNAHARESYDKMSAATVDASQLIQNACSTAADGAFACSAKVLEFTQVNSSAAFDYAGELLNVRSPSDFIKLSTQHARQQFDVLSGQIKELVELSRSLMLKTAAPFKASGTAFRVPLA